MTKKNLTASLICALTTLFYLYTLSPSLAWGDGTKLQGDVILGESFILTEMTAGEFTPDLYPFARVGVAAWDHPLYIMLGHIFIKTFPSVDSLWLVNLISAIFGTLSVVLVFQLCYQFTRSLFASAYASLALAVSHTFWWHSVTPEVYTLFVFLLLLCFYFFDHYERTGQSSALLYSGFFLGLAASNHILAFLAIPALALYFFLAQKFRCLRADDLKKTTPALLGFLAGFSIYIVQFIRVSRGLAFEELVGAAVGSTFLARLGTFSPIILGESLITYFLLLVFQFGPIGIIFGALGVRRIYTDKDRVPRKIISLFIVFMLFGVFYRVTDQFAFYLTSHVFFAILMAVGLGRLLATLQEKTRFTLTPILILTILLTPPWYHSVPRIAERNGVDDSFLKIPQIGTDVRNGFEYYIDPYKRGDFNAYNFGRETMRTLAPNAVVIAEWYTDTDEYFVLRYFNKIEGLRTDVTILSFPTDDPFSFQPQLVLNVIEDSFLERPIYLASLSEKFYATSTLMSKYCIVPENNLYRLYEKGSIDSQCLGIDAVTP